MVVITCNLHWWCFLRQLAHLHTNVHNYMDALCNLHSVVVEVCIHVCVVSVCVCVHAHNTVWQWCTCKYGQGCV